jgi:hypothetical protein
MAGSKARHATAIRARARGRVVWFMRLKVRLLAAKAPPASRPLSMRTACDGRHRLVTGFTGAGAA